jgi:hypothetical protein
MLDTVIDPGVGGEIDDLECELCSSSREASVGFVPFANLDLGDLARKVERWQTEHDLRAPWRR